MRKSIVVTGVAVLSLVGLCVGVRAASPTTHPAHGAMADGSGQPGPIRRFLAGQFGRLQTLRADLNLSADQKSQIKAIVVSHKGEIVGVLKPLSEHRRALRDAVLAETTDEAKIRAASDELGKSIGDAAIVAAKIRGEAQKVLTADQAKQIGAFRAQLDEHVDELMNTLAAN